jgi:inorganic pyrophosphatase
MDGASPPTTAAARVPQVRVTIEVPRGGFVKRDGKGRIEFVSPLPCPFNYGAVAGLPAGDGDWRDAVVLGPRLPRGAHVAVPVRGAIAFVDAGSEDLKLICSPRPLDAAARLRVGLFFAFYGVCKRVFNALRARPGRTASQGWRTRPSCHPQPIEETLP